MTGELSSETDKIRYKHKNYYLGQVNYKKLPVKGFKTWIHCLLVRAGSECLIRNTH